MASLSETLAAIHRKPGRWTIAGLPEGADALALAELARTTGGQDILHVARDGQRQRVGALGQAGDRPAAGLAMDRGQGPGKGFGKRRH